MTNLEKLAQTIYDECAKDGEPISMEDALEMAQMELGAKEIKTYAQAEMSKKKDKKPKTVKISQEKAEIFANICTFLQENYDFSVEIDNKLCKIYKNGKVFKLDLVETRQKAP